jgi:preprotein translocase subunit YajC
MDIYSLAMLAQAAPQRNPLIGALPFVVMFVLFWIMIIVPQRRQAKAHLEMVQALGKGDQVVTAGGLLGKVLRVDDHYVDLELAPNVKVKAVKSTIGDVVPPGSTQPAND